MKAVKVGALGREVLIDVGTIAPVVQVGGRRKPRSVYKIVVQLERERPATVNTLASFPGIHPKLLSLAV